MAVEHQHMAPDRLHMGRWVFDTADRRQKVKAATSNLNRMPRRADSSGYTLGKVWSYSYVCFDRVFRAREVRFLFLGQHIHRHPAVIPDGISSGLIS